MADFSAGSTTRAERMFSLERALVRIRWFGVALGVFQIATYWPNPGMVVPGSAIPIAYAGLGVLAIFNLFATILLRGAPGERLLMRAGAGIFAGDMLGLWAIVWAFNFDRYDNSWVLLLVLGLEGALRYGLRGALVPVGIAVPLETIREIVASSSPNRPFFVQSITFHVGFMLIIAAVAGVMARNLERQRAQAEGRAVLLEQLAERESQARRETSAFQEVILAGVSAASVRDALQSMISRIGTMLGYDKIAVLMLEDDGRLWPIAAHGFPESIFEESVAIGEGVVGAVALTKRSEIVPDVERDPRYFSVDPTTQSQINVPIVIGERLVGVIDVESARPAAFDATDRARLERLTTQMGLVIEQARLLAQERATVERLRDLDVMKSDFIAIASHELRTPLTSMQGSIKTLRHREIQLTREHRDELLGVLDRQSEKLARLVDDLLIASRIDAGHLSLHMENVDIPAVLEEVMQELNGKRGRVSLAVPSALPRLVTDGQRLGQIARNLIENALKFCPEQSSVRVNVHQDGNSLLLEVEDDGPGIPDSELAMVFERFHQVGGSMRRRAEGFGLGLYITKRLVEALGGTIEVESRLGRGTTFRVRVPLALASPGKEEIA